MSLLEVFPMGNYILSHKYLNIAFEIQHALELGIVTDCKNSGYVPHPITVRSVIFKDLPTEEDYLGAWLTV